MRLLRFIVLQIVMLAGLVALYANGWLERLFMGDGQWFTAAVAGLGLIGLGLIALRRYDGAQWLAEKMIRLAIVGMQVGILTALATLADSVLSGGDVTRGMALFLSAISVAFYVSLTALACNLWLSLNLKLLADIDA